MENPSKNDTAKPREKPEHTKQSFKPTGNQNNDQPPDDIGKFESVYKVDCAKKIKDWSTYKNWLRNKARKLYEIDIKMQRIVKSKVVKSHYYKPIHAAVKHAINDGDFYTGEILAWDILGKHEDPDDENYSQNKSTTKKSPSKPRPADYPTVDHVAPHIKHQTIPPALVICRDDTNKMKADMLIETVHGKVELLRRRGFMTTGIALQKAKIT